MAYIFQTMTRNAPIDMSVPVPPPQPFRSAMSLKIDPKDWDRRNVRLCLRAVLMRQQDWRIGQRCDLMFDLPSGVGAVRRHADGLLRFGGIRSNLGKPLAAVVLCQWNAVAPNIAGRWELVILETLANQIVFKLL